MSAAARKKVLLVDDSKVVLMLERAILGEARFELLTAHDGVEAVEVAERERPALILMDVVMPRLDGFGALRRLRGSAATARIPVVMVTTRGEAESMIDGYESGACDYIVKPIDERELVAKVESILGE
jgi:DNA-binding response OmpR family regulator